MGKRAVCWTSGPWLWLNRHEIAQRKALERSTQLGQVLGSENGYASVFGGIPAAVTFHLDTGAPVAAVAMSSTAEFLATAGFRRESGPHLPPDYSRRISKQNFRHVVENPDGITV